jgi:hypothetical protein
MADGDRVDGPGQRENFRVHVAQYVSSLIFPNLTFLSFSFFIIWQVFPLFFHAFFLPSPSTKQLTPTNHTNKKIFFFQIPKVIMQMPPRYCPPAGECYCMTFGLCNLTCTVTNCEKRYVLPIYAAMPKGWPKKGGGKNGWPVPGWNA